MSPRQLTRRGRARNCKPDVKAAAACNKAINDAGVAHIGSPASRKRHDAVQRNSIYRPSACDVDDGTVRLYQMGFVGKLFGSTTRSSLITVRSCGRWRCRAEVFPPG